MLAAPRPPADFQIEAHRANRYLDRALRYQWTLIKRGTVVPKGETCIVLCGAFGSQKADSRCIAFAAFERGHVRWYGVTAGYQEPAELYGVEGYVRVADAITFFELEIDDQRRMGRPVCGKAERPEQNAVG